MPRILGAKKKLRQDLKRTKTNSVAKNRYVKALKRATSKAGAKVAKQAQSMIDKAAKKGIVAKNKAARLKSRLSQKTKK